MNFFQKYIDRLIFSKDKIHPDSFRKGRFLIYSMLLIAILATTIISVLLLSHSVSFVVVLPVLPLVFATVLIAVLYSKFGKRILLANLFAALFNTNVFVIYNETGGIFSSDNINQIVIACWVFLVADKKSGVGWFVFAFISFLLFYYAEAMGLKDFRNDFDKMPSFYPLINYMIPGAFMLIIIYLHETGKDKYLKEVAQAKVEIEDKNRELKLKNEDILSSITYAKRIQQAILPPTELIYKTIPDLFILYKPKDIVSGDFYYFHKNDKSVFIASADCTGHGVPGAFMSMIGSEKLEDALAHSTDTSEILRHLNIGIKSSLRQTDNDESTRDGMDIALCSVDIDARVVKYAGANRPLWIIRNGQTVVEEIKATKKAIGGFTEDSQHFDTHVVQLQQGDTFYISTDGYADTFGKDGKKLMTKTFKEILLGIQDKTMQDQELHLDNFIEDWKGGTEQVDDILVIGVRL